jgi:metallo-beta-lactamase family protein
VSIVVTFLGAAREVTGSCILVQTSGVRFLVDCGMFQGGAESEAKNSRPFPVPLSSIDFVLSTHAHLDHSGLLPRIVRDGFRGPIYATSATADLLGVMLPDSGHIQEREAEWQTRRALRAGRRDGQPLYTEVDALAVLPRLKPVSYGQAITPAPGVTARFLDAGHILGSAIVCVTVRDAGKDEEFVFTGDLGHRAFPSFGTRRP